jgi:WD40 repeat protein
MAIDWRRIRRPGPLGWTIHLLGCSLRLFAIAGLGAAILGVIEQSSSEDTPRSAETSSGLIEQFQLSGQVWSLAFSGDNRHLAAAAITGEVFVKDLAGGHTLRVHDGPASSVLALAFAPRGSVLTFTSAKPALRLWDADSRTAVAGFATDINAARSLAFSPDGAILAIGEWIGLQKRWAVSVWDWKSRRHIALLDVDRVSIKGLAFSPDGTRLAIGDNEGIVTLWNVRGWRKLASFRAHRPAQGGVASLAFAPNDAVLATAGLFESTVRLWDPVTGKPLGAVTATGDVNALAFSPDGALLVTAQADGNLGVWDHASARQVGVAPTGKRLHSLAFSSDGRLLATGSVDGTVRLWGFEQFLGHLLDSRYFELSQRQVSGDNQGGRWQFHRGVDDVDGGRAIPRRKAPSSRSLVAGRRGLGCARRGRDRDRPVVHAGEQARRGDGGSRSRQPVLAAR